MRSKIPFTVLCCAALVGIVPHAKASPQSAMLGQEAWSAFECAAYAEIARNGTEQVRLFRVGYEAGREFFEAVHYEQVTSEELSLYVPNEVRFILASPNAEFFLGRVFEAALELAWAQIANSAGVPLDEIRFRVNAELVREAQSLYESTNCEGVGSD